MARPLSLDLRVRVAAELAEGSTVGEAAKRFGVSVASAVRIGQLARAGQGLAARTAIRGAGAKLFFLPAYSPDLNPIKIVFAKLKTLLRKADERSIEANWRKIGDLLAGFSTEECAAYRRHRKQDLYLRGDVERGPSPQATRVLRSIFAFWRSFERRYPLP